MLTNITNANLVFEGDGGGNGGGSNAPAWIAQLPGDLQGNEAFTSFATIGDLAKGYLETGGKVKELEGSVAGMVRVPGEGVSAEEANRFYKAMGVPDKAEGYELTNSFKLPDGLGDAEKNDITQIAKEYGDMVRDMAFNQKLPPKAAQALHDDLVGSIVEAYVANVKEQNANAEKASNELKTAWNQNYDANIELSKRVAENEKLNERIPGLKEWYQGRSTDPMVTRIMHFVATQIADDKAFGGPGSAGGGNGREGIGVTVGGHEVRSIYPVK